MASSQEWCLTSCDQENRMSKTVKQALCYKSIQGWQAGAGSGCRGFVLSTGKKMRKDEQLGSKRGLGFCFCLLLIVQQWRGGGGRDAWSGWPWAPGWAQEPAEPCPEQGGNIHDLLCQILWQMSVRPAGLDPGLVLFGSSMAHGRATHALGGFAGWGPGEPSLARHQSLCLWSNLSSGLLYRKGQSALIASLTPLSQFKALLYCSQLFTDTLYEDKDPCLVLREI